MHKKNHFRFKSAVYAGAWLCAAAIRVHRQQQQQQQHFKSTLLCIAAIYIFISFFSLDLHCCRNNCAN